jgi:hypothetical protein
MDTSPVSPEDIRAAAEVHDELGPEYQDAVVAAFIDKVEREVDARVRVRLAAMRPAEAAPLRPGAVLKGLALGAGAGALVAFAAISAGSTHAAPGPPVRAHDLPYIFRGPGLNGPAGQVPAPRRPGS